MDLLLHIRFRVAEVLICFWKWCTLEGKITWVLGIEFLQNSKCCEASQSIWILDLDGLVFPALHLSNDLWGICQAWHLSSDFWRLNKDISAKRQKYVKGNTTICSTECQCLWSREQSIWLPGNLLICTVGAFRLGVSELKKKYFCPPNLYLNQIPENCPWFFFFFFFICQSCISSN